MLALCLILLETYCAENYAGRIGLGLPVSTKWLIISWFSHLSVCKSHPVIGNHTSFAFALVKDLTYSIIIKSLGI